MFKNSKYGLLFKHGKNDYIQAIIAAQKCLDFKLDKDEDELVTATKQDSCYNCLYRKWTKDSFLCMKHF